MGSKVRGRAGVTTFGRFLELSSTLKLHKKKDGRGLERLDRWEAGTENQKQRKIQKILWVWVERKKKIQIRRRGNGGKITEGIFQADPFREGSPINTRGE